jgi:hypothetical protein
MESVFGWKYLGTMLVAVSLIEPGTLLSVKEAEMLGTGKTSQNPKKQEQTGREKQKAAVESSRNC